MTNIMRLEECGIEIAGGQIMGRVTAQAAGEETIEKRKVLIPKCINGDGTINVSEMPEEGLKTLVDKKKMTEAGDIVIKLSTPYDAALVTQESAGAVVPSFCAIIKSTGTLEPSYLLAFLNSSYCKDQLKMQVAGSVMTVLSVGKIKGVHIPVPSSNEQKEIGAHYLATQEKLKIVQKIVELESKRNDVIFKEMVKSNG
ncbi:MAG: restriction endonuclease subunit S [Lachnospiraceae bacterium]|nr:restriction endonuclease subunit S [Candidatus Darwinimomas equi]